MQNIKFASLFNCFLRKSRVEGWSNKQISDIPRCVYLICMHTTEHIGVHRHIHGQFLHIPVLPIWNTENILLYSEPQLDIVTLFATVGLTRIHHSSHMSRKYFAHFIFATYLYHCPQLPPTYPHSSEVVQNPFPLWSFIFRLPVMFSSFELSIPNYL